MANCNCNCKNGQDALDFLTSVPGGTAADATYQLGLTHYTCGGRKMTLADPTHPVVSQLTATQRAERNARKRNTLITCKVNYFA